MDRDGRLGARHSPRCDGEAGGMAAAAVGDIRTEADHGREAGVAACLAAGQDKDKRNAHVSG